MFTVIISQNIRMWYECLASCASDVQSGTEKLICASVYSKYYQEKIEIIIDNSVKRSKNTSMFLFLRYVNIITTTFLLRNVPNKTHYFWRSHFSRIFYKSSVPVQTPPCFENRDLLLNNFYRGNTSIEYTTLCNVLSILSVS